MLCLSNTDNQKYTVDSAFLLLPIEGSLELFKKNTFWVMQASMVNPTFIILYCKKSIFLFVIF